MDIPFKTIKNDWKSSQQTQIQTTFNVRSKTFQGKVAQKQADIQGKKARRYTLRRMATTTRPNFNEFNDFNDHNKVEQNDKQLLEKVESHTTNQVKPETKEEEKEKTVTFDVLKENLQPMKIKKEKDSLDPMKIVEEDNSSQIIIEVIGDYDDDDVNENTNDEK